MVAAVMAQLLIRVVAAVREQHGRLTDVDVSADVNNSINK